MYRHRMITCPRWLGTHSFFTQQKEQKRRDSLMMKQPFELEIKYVCIF